MNPTLKQPSAWIPISMSLAALAIVLGHIAMYGVAREADEGTAAHLFQILIAAQVPLIAVFALTRLKHGAKQALVVLALQASAILAAIAPVWFLGL
jgi:hypothetical protein